MDETVGDGAPSLALAWHMRPPEAAAGLATDLLNVVLPLHHALDGIPESWLGRPLPREGWTVRHEVARQIAGHGLLTALLRAAGAGATGWTAAEVRRRVGEGMLTVQHLRLAPLREALLVSGEQTADLLRAESAHLRHSFTLGDSAHWPVVRHWHEAISRDDQGMAAVLRTLGVPPADAVSRGGG